MAAPDREGIAALAGNERSREKIGHSQRKRPIAVDILRVESVLLFSHYAAQLQGETPAVWLDHHPCMAAAIMIAVPSMTEAMTIASATL